MNCYFSVNVLVLACTILFIFVKFKDSCFPHTENDAWCLLKSMVGRSPSTGAQFPCTIFTTKAGHSIRCHAHSGNLSYGVVRGGRMDTLLLHVTDLVRTGGGCTGYAIIGRTTPLKVLWTWCRRLVKPLDHLPLNGVFYPVYCVLRLLSYLWDALWSLSWSGIFPFRFQMIRTT